MNKKQMPSNLDLIKTFHPKYINPNCPKCNAQLILSDILDNPEINIKEIDPESFACPKCYDGDGIYLDWPQKKLNHLNEIAKDAIEHPEKLIPWEKIKTKLYKKFKIKPNKKTTKQSKNLKTKGIINI